MLYIEKEVDIDLSFLEDIVDDLTSKDVELILCSNERMKFFNKSFRNEDSITDVLSFPMQDLPLVPLGSIVISFELAKEKADALKHNLKDEIALLFIHGMLHLLGFDHEKDNGEMRVKEEELIKLYNLPKSLILRSNDT